MSFAREIHVGTPPPDYSKEESVTVHFHDFANLPDEKEEGVSSPIFAIAGFEWSLEIFPGGDDTSQEGMTLTFATNYRLMLVWIMRYPSLGVMDANMKSLPNRRLYFHQMNGDGDVKILPHVRTYWMQVMKFSRVARSDSSLSSSQIQNITVKHSSNLHLDAVILPSWSMIRKQDRMCLLLTN